MVSAKGPSRTSPAPGPRSVQAPLRRPEPRRRPELALAGEPVVDLVQFGHQRRILLARPGRDDIFHVIGQ